MAKKGKGKLYAIGGLVAIVLVAVLFVDSDDIGNLTQLNSEDGTNTFNLIVPTNSLLPDDSNFDPIINTNFPLHGAECKVKHTIRVYDVNGQKVFEQGSRGVQGLPQIQTNTLVSGSGVEIAYYKIEPRIFCEVNDSFPNLEIQPSALNIDVLATQPVGTGQTVTEKLVMLTLPVVFKAVGGNSEQSLGFAYIQGDDVAPQIVNDDFTSQLTFRVYGNINVGFVSGISTLYELPIAKGTMDSHYSQKVLKDSDPDSDGDGIKDTSDDCPFQPETLNNYLDDDGCPDTNPNGGGGSTVCATCPPPEVVTKISCNAEGKTWYKNNVSQEYCSTAYKIVQHGIQITCNEFDISAGECIDPLQTGKTTQDNKDECADKNGVYRASNGLPRNQVFTSDELQSAGSVIEHREGTSSIITAYCLVPDVNPPNAPFGNTQDVINYAEDGKIISEITITFTDNTQDIFLASEAGSYKQGFVTGLTTNELTGTTPQGVEKEITTIRYDTYYTRDTLTEAQRLQLTGSTIQIIPRVSVEGSSVIHTLPPENLGNSDTGLKGKSVLGGSEFGFLLGSETFTSALIESGLPSSIQGDKKIALHLSTDGQITVRGDDLYSAGVTVKGEQVTLNGLFIDRTIPPKECGDQVLNSKNICVPCPEGSIKIDSHTCSIPKLVCELPEIQVGDKCDIPPSDKGFEECHNDFTPPQEPYGSECRPVPLGGTTQVCTDDHTSHSAFPCTIDYRTAICGSPTSTQCGLPVEVVCDPVTEVQVGDKCEPIERICVHGETFNCTQLPSFGYCDSIGKIYNPDKVPSTCDDVDDGTCNDEDYALLHPAECKPDGECLSPKVLTGNECHDACLSTEKYSTVTHQCEPSCPSGTTFNTSTKSCEINPDNDRDGDGFLNTVDACPDIYAPAFTGSKNGCPVDEICVGEGCNPPVLPKWLTDILNDPTAQIVIIALIIIISIVAIIKRRSSY